MSRPLARAALVLFPLVLSACGNSGGTGENAPADASDAITVEDAGEDATAADSSAVDTALDETSADTTATDTGSAETAAPDTTAGDTTPGETSASDTGAADTAASDATAADTSTADTTAASDSASMDTTAADTSTADTSTADTFVADTSIADSATDSGGDAGPLAPLDLSAGGGHTCARMSDLTVKCWGRNVFRQLGISGTTVTAPAASVFGVTNVAEVAAGGGHTCARISDGTVKCWGRNDQGELGLGTGGTGSGNWEPPTTVPGLGSVAQLALGPNHSCALLTTGAVKCWGENEAGQLGIGALSYAQTSPVDVRLFGSKVVQLSTNGGDTGTLFGQTCGVLDDATVKCWGANYYGQMGTGMTGGTQTIPALVPGLTNVKSVGVGFSHVCALLNDGTVKCWGRNDLGEIGIGTKSTTVHEPTPKTVLGLTSPVVELAVGAWHACARMNDGVVKCWGSNETGQIGDGGLGTGASRATPATVLGLTSPSALSAGSLHTCARASGLWSCWGYNTYGQLGTGSTMTETTPALVKF